MERRLGWTVERRNSPNNKKTGLLKKAVVAPTSTGGCQEQGGIHTKSQGDRLEYHSR